MGISDAAAVDDIDSMHKVLERMLILGVKPNKVTLENFLRTLLRLVRSDLIPPSLAASQAEGIMMKLQVHGVKPDKHTFQLMTKIYETHNPDSALSAIGSKS